MAEGGGRRKQTCRAPPQRPVNPARPPRQQVPPAQGWPSLPDLSRSRHPDLGWPAGESSWPRLDHPGRRQHLPSLQTPATSHACPGLQTWATDQAQPLPTHQTQLEGLPGSLPTLASGLHVLRGAPQACEGAAKMVSAASVAVSPRVTLSCSAPSACLGLGPRAQPYTRPGRAGPGWAGRPRSGTGVQAGSCSSHPGPPGPSAECSCQHRGLPTDSKSVLLWQGPLALLPAVGPRRRAPQSGRAASLLPAEVCPGRRGGLLAGRGAELSARRRGQVLTGTEDSVHLGLRGCRRLQRPRTGAGLGLLCWGSYPGGKSRRALGQPGKTSGKQGRKQDPPKPRRVELQPEEPAQSVWGCLV